MLAEQLFKVQDAQELNDPDKVSSTWVRHLYGLVDPILPRGGQNMPPPVFLHHPKTAQSVKLKLSDFKDTPLRHILQVKPVH